jgi:hypothetical protein
MKAVFEITGIENRQETVINNLDFSVKRGRDVIIESPLDSEATLNDHLVWWWGRLKHQRKFLKGLQQDGAKLNFKFIGYSGNIVVKSNGAEMLHLLKAELVVEK